MSQFLEAALFLLCDYTHNSHTFVSYWFKHF